MVLSLMASPVRMIFSLLLMQGISLTMFRALLNQAIQRVDPLKFQLNLGNTNFSGNTPGPPPSPPTSSLPTVSSSVSPTSILPLLGTMLTPPPPPTPAPLVDQRTIDLIHLIRALQQQQQPQSISGSSTPTTTGQPTTIQLVQSPPMAPQTQSPIMSAPIITLNPTSASTSAISGVSSSISGQPIYPQIIIVPSSQPAAGGGGSTVSLKTSASSQHPIATMKKEQFDPETYEGEDDEIDLETIKKRIQQRNKERMKKKLKRKQSESLAQLMEESSSSSTDDNMRTADSLEPDEQNLIIFKAVGHNFIGGVDDN